jgi:RNA polymerase sigma-70 factor (ECF subfamily)
MYSQTPPGSPFSNLLDLDQHAFSALTEPHRRELQAHCYRMLGSLEDAEELVQETFLRAWRRRETYAGRAPLRAWLYRIATNACLDSLAQRPRRTVPLARGAAASLDDPIPPSIDEPIWLEPFPDELLTPAEDNPEARYTRQESIALAFITSLQLLTPSQRAVLILRDVLGWPASEVAQALELSVPAVKSALHRARATLSQRYLAVRLEDMSVAVADVVLRRQLELYLRAWQMGDAAELVSLLKADATFSMPPIPAWYRGRETIHALVSKTVFAGAARGYWRLLPTRANLQPAFGIYQLSAGRYRAYGIQVLTFDGLAIADIITFRNPGLLPRFNLPTVMASNDETRTSADKR